jgi:hypothetical protein
MAIVSAKTASIPGILEVSKCCKIVENTKIFHE